MNCTQRIYSRLSLKVTYVEARFLFTLLFHFPILNKINKYNKYNKNNKQNIMDESFFLDFSHIKLSLSCDIICSD